MSDPHVTNHSYCTGAILFVVMILPSSCGPQAPIGRTTYKLQDGTTERDLFRLVVDSSGPSPFVDAAGRHEVRPIGAVEATDEIAPDGSHAALFRGGWVEVVSTQPDSRNDLAFPASDNVALSFYFKSSINHAQEPPEHIARMQAIGFGHAHGPNLDVDFGDVDRPENNVSTSCWTFYGGGGSPHVVDVDSQHGRNYLLDSNWHLYRLERSGAHITVTVDNQTLGTDTFWGEFAVDAEGAKNYVGRASAYTENITRKAYPWGGFIAGVTVVQTTADECTQYVNILRKCFGERAAEHAKSQLSVSADNSALHDECREQRKRIGRACQGS